MGSIVNKLTEIESAASAIIAHAETQKETLEHEYQAKRKAFDDDLERRTSTQIGEIREQLEQNIAALLSNQSSGTSDSITALQQEYESCHTKYAQDILKQITEVS